MLIITDLEAMLKSEALLDPNSKENTFLTTTTAVPNIADLMSIVGRATTQMTETGLRSEDIATRMTGELMTVDLINTDTVMTTGVRIDTGKTAIVTVIVSALETETVTESGSGRGRETATEIVTESEIVTVKEIVIVTESENESEREIEIDIMIVTAKEIALETSHHDLRVPKTSGGQRRFDDLTNFAASATTKTNVLKTMMP